MTPTPRQQPAASRLPRFRSVEAAKLLEHQMYFWGKDVLHPAGNLLVAFGGTPFRRDDAPHAVRCYALTVAEGRMILHSTGVVFQPDQGRCGIAYLRPAHRLYHVPPGEMPLPCPSAKAIASNLRTVRPGEFPPTLTRLLHFVRDYETWAAQRLPNHARDGAWREFRRTASHGTQWLPPAESRRWLDACLPAAAPPGMDMGDTGRL
jgi:hypothetical protein